MTGMKVMFHLSSCQTNGLSFGQAKLVKAENIFDKDRVHEDRKVYAFVHLQQMVLRRWSIGQVWPARGFSSATKVRVEKKKNRY